MYRMSISLHKTFDVPRIAAKPPSYQPTALPTQAPRIAAKPLSNLHILPAVNNFQQVVNFPKITPGVFLNHNLCLVISP